MKLEISSYSLNHLRPLKKKKKEKQFKECYQCLKLLVARVSYWIANRVSTPTNNSVKYFEMPMVIAARLSMHNSFYSSINFAAVCRRSWKDAFSF